MNSYVIDQTRWTKLSIFEQMGNIYSEVGRSFKAKVQGDKTSSQSAMSRAIDLFDATVNSLVANKSPRVKEVLRAKEQYLATINNMNADLTSIQSLDRYFMQFAIAARLNH